jgi:ribosome biogenesis GTPase
VNDSGLVALGWDTHFAGQLADADASLIPVRIMSVHRSAWRTRGASSEHLVAPRGDLAATVGDWLMLTPDGERAVRRLERKSLFKRRAPGTDRREQLIAANVDTLFVVSSCNQDFNPARLERYLALGREAGVLAVIVLTKADECAAPENYVRRAARLAAGVHVEALNALDPASASALRPWLEPGQTVAMLGSSGVGKSTLTNTLLGDTRAATRAIREDDAKGRHTTTARELHCLPGRAWLLDTPGMRELQLVDVEHGLDDVFHEIVSLSGDCRFADCTHEAEPGCAVQAALERGEIDEARLARWRKLSREARHNRESLAERRARDKSTGKLYKSIIADTKHRKGRS